MYKIEKGRPFYFALKSLIYTYNIPKDLDKSKLFWFKSLFIKFVAIVFTIVEPILHIVMTLINGNGIDISEDIAILMAYVGVITGLILLTAQYKKWSYFLKEVASFEDVEDVSIYAERLKKFNIVTVIYYGFCITGLSVYGIIKFTQTRECEQLNQEKNLREVCGTFFPVWLPLSNINLTTLIIIFAAQIIICVAILPSGAMVTCVIWESTEILIIYTDILKERFTNLFEEPEEISDRLRFCVNYHVCILSMASRLNSLMKRTSSHMAFLAALAFGVILNQLINTNAGIGAVFFLVGYITAIFFLCHSGERIKNQTLSVVDAIWASNWHKAEPETMKDLAFIMFRSQKPICYEALPLGTLDYLLFLMILKTSYSYMTLLNDTM